jgi:adenine-specific DNA glycosylase
MRHNATEQLALLQQQQQQLELTEADVVAAGGEAHYLLVQRPPTGLLAGLWEFPGGRGGTEHAVKT